MITNEKNLARLESVELREIWDSESGDFTPWLAQEENLALLGEAIDVDLEMEAQEKEVGPFRADILCKDAATNAWVIVENQLESTDHIHLGQLLTYAAGLKATTIVWIAKEFTDQHRAVLDWLNNDKDAIEREIGFSLDWGDGDDEFQWIGTSNDDADPANRTDWPSQHLWLAEKLDAFHGVFASRIRELELDEEPDGDDE